MKKFLLILVFIVIIDNILLKSQQIGDGYAPQISNQNTALLSGNYTSHDPLGSIPTGGWQNLFVIRHGNAANNYQLQIGSSIFIDERLFFRKIAVGDLSSGNSSWVEMATRNANSFIGNQTINGELKIVSPSHVLTPMFKIQGTESGSAELELNRNSSGRTSGIDFTTGGTKDWFIGTYYRDGGPQNNFGIGTGNLIANQKLIIDANGNVGIGTSNPYSAMLHIDKSLSNGIGGSLFLTNSASPSIGNKTRLGFDLIGFDDIIPTASIDATLTDVAGATDLIFNAYDGSGSIANYERIRVLGSNGNVLIGKISQTGDYKLDVAGRIRANEIVINTSGADFVFSPSYKLRTLSELEQFVKTNNHLPEIPSATEMQQQGVSVSDMQTKLLQKVEELTLYVIEQQKTIDELKKENKEIRNLIK